jgi:uncharacterized protein YjiK
VKWQFSFEEPKIYDQTNNNFMHKKRLRKPNPTPNQSTTPSTQRQTLTLNTLRITFTGRYNTFSNMSFISNILITTNNTDTKRNKQTAQLIKTHVLSCTKTTHQKNTSAMIYNPPKPTLRKFVRNTRPHLIKLYLSH